MSGERAQLLRSLARQVRAGDPDGQLRTIEQIGLGQLFTFETMMDAMRAGGIELAAFIAELGTEHSTDPARYRDALQVCRTAQETTTIARSDGRRETVALATELLKIFTQKKIPAKIPASTSERLLILDDYFPAMPAGFRMAEYHAYLERYPHAWVRSTGTTFRHALETRSVAAVVGDYEAAYPAFAGRVRPFSPRTVPAARLVYTVFVQNAYKFIPVAEAGGAGLVFTLYPGGGFQLNDPECDRKLRRVFSSPSFRSVIVTQTITQRYLLDKKFCPPEKIRYIFGGVLPIPQQATAPRRHFGVDKPTLDICFVANRYMPGGVDKGFDTFLSVARRLAAEFPTARFHVVGTLTAADGDLTGLDGLLTFHGIMKTDALHRFFAEMDLILSPNVPFKLRPGGFDGFPTGSCVEAGLCGVAVFCSDELKLNTAFQDGEELVLLTRNPDEIFATVAAYCHDPARLRQLAARGTAAFQRVFSLAEQMGARFAVLDEFLAAPS
jgi:glycosyltransferase involved in cell wall biosynthesis